MSRESFKYILAGDCETTGLCFNSLTPVHSDDKTVYHQAVSWGLIVADAQTFEPIEKLYLEIKWNDISKKQKQQDPTFGAAAAKIHNLGSSYLEQNGVDEPVAATEIANLIFKYWNTTKVTMLGHNVATFDLFFIRDLLGRYNINVPFGSRHIDTWSCGYTLFNTLNSNELFELLGGVDQRKTAHNALDDADMALTTIRNIRQLSNKYLR